MVMHRRKHISAARRLVSAVAAVALVFAQLIGIYAHAAEHDHATGHAACAHHHGQDAAAPTGSGDPRLDKAAQDSGDRVSHHTSCDLICHGGAAILAAGEGCAYVGSTRIYAPAIGVVVDPSQPPSLERPPKSAVRT